MGEFEERSGATQKYKLTHFDLLFVRGMFAILKKLFPMYFDKTRFSSKKVEKKFDISISPPKVTSTLKVRKNRKMANLK